ncbi:hypothetical protein MJ390_22940 [Klebsiella pneumoniae]|nr:hypothetical protein MJ390_22940 [Klebsiella pneumoniae]
MSLVDGPFKKLIGGWKFIPLSPEACKNRIPSRF